MASIDRGKHLADQATAGIAGHGGVAGQANNDAREGAAEYLVPRWVRVRPEDFGLLFYDTRSTRLTFVRSGDRLAPPPFTGESRVLRVCGRSQDAALARLLGELVAKGLLIDGRNDG